MAALGFAAAGLICGAGSAAAQGAAPEYRADVERLFAEVLHPSRLEAQRHLIVPAIATALRKGFPDLAERSLEIYSAELGAAVDAVLKEPARLGEVVAPFIARHFSHDELKQILAFYRSPAGRRWQQLVFGEKLIEQAFASWAQARVPDICRRTNLRLRDENLPLLPAGACRN